MTAGLRSAKGTLHASWTPDGAVFWGWNGETAVAPTPLRNTMARLLGRHWAEDTETVQLPIRFPDGREPSLPALLVDPMSTMSMLQERFPNADWSPSLRWFRSAAGLAMLAGSTGRVLPHAATEGLKWSAGWRVIDDPALESQLERLEQMAPPVVSAALLDDTTMVAQRVVSGLADGACRLALAQNGWRPDLERSRSSPAVALRRLTTALIEDPIFVGSTEYHEAAFATWSAGLSELRSIAEGAVPTHCRGRLLPPEVVDRPDDPDEEDDEDATWRIEFEVISADDPSLVVPWSEVWDNTSAARQMVDGGPLTPVRRHLRETALRLASRVTVLESLADEHEPTGVDLSIGDVGFLLVDGLEICERAGAPILVPAGLVQRRARLTASATPREEGGINAGLGEALVDVDWGLALGNDPLDPGELELLAAAKSGLVRMRGEWVQVDQDQVEVALKSLSQRQSKESQLSAADLLRTAAEAVAAGDWETADGADASLLTGAEVSADGWMAELLAGLPDEELTEAEEPDGFVGTLRPYQRRAVGWLQFLGRLGLGGCLADDMGLGKTPTTLAHLQYRLGMQTPENHRPSLVICPLSVVQNWRAEAANFTPGVRVMVAHGANRPRLDAFVHAAQQHDLVISTYGTVSRDVESFGEVAWDLVVCDEAQAVKNHHTRSARSVRKLEARQKLALTGTPVENRLLDLWAILDAVNPGMLGGVNWFRDRFATPIEQRGDDEALAGLHQMTGPFLLRRTKSNRSLVPDLPDKIEQVAWASLTREQASLYKAVVDDFLSAADDEDGMKRRGLVLATLTKLKQICNHPAHFLNDGGGLAGRSGKLIRFDELVDELLDADERALVFTQYRTMGEILATHIKDRLDLTAPFLHGGVPKKRRDAMVERFQSGDGPPLQIVSVKAGGTGLNLTKASRVIHYDRWWNPAVEDQATDRAWRIGQESTVFVHKLVCQGTLEERIDGLLTKKKELADSVVGSGEAWLTEMTTDELRELMTLDQSMLEQSQPDKSADGTQ